MNIINNKLYFIVDMKTEPLWYEKWENMCNLHIIYVWCWSGTLTTRYRQRNIKRKWIEDKKWLLIHSISDYLFILLLLNVVTSVTINISAVTYVGYYSVVGLFESFYLSFNFFLIQNFTRIPKNDGDKAEYQQVSLF